MGLGLQALIALHFIRVVDALSSSVAINDKRPCRSCVPAAPARAGGAANAFEKAGRAESSRCHPPESLDGAPLPLSGSRPSCFFLRELPRSLVQRPLAQPRGRL